MLSSIPDLNLEIFKNLDGEEEEQPNDSTRNLLEVDSNSKGNFKRRLKKF